MLTLLKNIISLVASSLDREVEKPGFSSWVFHRLIENCSTKTEGLISTNGRSHLVLCGVCCCFVFGGGFFSSEWLKEFGFLLEQMLHFLYADKFIEQNRLFTG